MSKVRRCCPICGSIETHRVYDNIMAEISGYDMSYTVGSCNKCGFVFADSLADQTTIRSYYQSLSKYDIANVISDIDSLRIDGAVKICIEEKIPQNSVVIDLGCGYGALLSRALSRESGCGCGCVT